MSDNEFYDEYDEYDEDYGNLNDDDNDNLEEADYDDVDVDDIDDIDDFDDMGDDSFNITNAPEWRGNETGKSRVGLNVMVGGIEDLSTFIGGNSEFAKKQQKINQFDGSSPEVSFKTIIYSIQNEYKFNPSVVSTVEKLINKIPHIEFKNPLAIMLAVSILDFNPSTKTTSIDMKLFSDLNKNISYDIEKKSSKYSKLEKAKESKNISPMDILRYARFLLPIINQSS